MAQSSYQVYTVSSVTVIVVFVTVYDAILPDDVVPRILDDVVGNNQAATIISFQPESMLNMCKSILKYQYQMVTSAVFYQVPVKCKGYVTFLLDEQEF